MINMDILRKKQPSRKLKYKESRYRKRLKYAKAKKNSLGTGTTMRLGVVNLESGIKLPVMPYDDILEVSRLTEELLMGHDISHFDSPSKAAKSYVQNFSKRNKENRATEAMYNKVNKRIVMMNRGSALITDNSKKLYRALMDEESEE